MFLRDDAVESLGNCCSLSFVCEMKTVLPEEIDFLLEDNEVMVMQAKKFRGEVKNALDS